MGTSLRALYVTLVIVSLGLGACSFSFSMGDKDLDTAKLETELKTQIAAQTDVPIGSADCPDDVAIEQGNTFNCTVTTADGTPLTVIVTQDDDEGNVSWELEP